MNLSQVKKVKNGDKVVFINLFPAFTEGKEYEIYNECWIKDDNGMGIYIDRRIHLEHCFEKKEEVDGDGKEGIQGNHG